MQCSKDFPVTDIDAGPGDHTRIQLEGSYAEGELDGRQDGSDPITNVLLDASDFTEHGGFDSQATLEVDVRNWEVGLRALTDARADASGVGTPSLMIFGGAASQDYDASMLRCFPATRCFEDFVRHDVDSWYVGVEAAVAATVNLTPALTLTLGGRVAGLYFDADMDGEDCEDNSETAGCNAARTSSVDDGLNAVTYRGGGFGGVSYDFGGASVGIMGTADYVPMADIVNPSSRTIEAFSSIRLVRRTSDECRLKAGIASTIPVYPELHAWSGRCGVNGYRPGFVGIY